MKLLRIKITDPSGFRSLRCGFEHHFRNEWSLQDELSKSEGFAPFVCAGPNGSGKSNLLEALAAIFYHLECIHLSNLPSSFIYDPEENPNGFRGEKGEPDGFEIEYLIHPKYDMKVEGYGQQARVLITKEPGKFPKWYFLNSTESEGRHELVAGSVIGRHLLPDYILAYSSGQNEILSLPFFKTRFVQFDEYWNALKQQLPYSGGPETRLAYLDTSFSQAILLCNLLFQGADALKPFRDAVKVEGLKEFRIIIKRSIEVSAQQAAQLTSGDYVLPGYTSDGYFADNPAISLSAETGNYIVKLTHLLEGDEKTSIIEKLKRCATCSFVDEKTDTLYLDFYVNDATKEAFKANFDNSPVNLFQALQVLLTLNLYSVSEASKAVLYQSDSLYVSETIPVLASDQRIMRIKHFWLKKSDVEKPVLLKSLSDGEHQLLHSLGLCLLFKNTNSLFLLDEPETHFNPDWRSNFISLLRQCFSGADDIHEMLVTTHTPFLISDSKPEKVLVFKKENGEVGISQPDYNTLGASINKITMSTFGKRETIGGHAHAILGGLRARFDRGGEDKDALIEEINQQLGDSVEKVMLIKTILDSMEERG
jgi:restriction system-associated AAA family ATPase